MFSFFRKKKGINSKDFAFLRAIVENLPKIYNYLLIQISEDFILDKEPNPVGKVGQYTLILDSNLESKYVNYLLPTLFILKDIKIWNVKTNTFSVADLHIVNGILVGFKIDSNYDDLDINRIDVSGIKEKLFNNDDKEKLLSIIGVVSDVVISQIDINNSFKIEIDNNSFYTLKDFGDGNYLSVDSKGIIYGMIHDPYEIEKLYDNKNDFFEALETKKFNIAEYYREKISN